MIQNTNILKTVTTYDGTTALRKNCRYIRKQFYEINKQCFLVAGKWHRINNGLILYDHSIQEWVLKKDFYGYEVIIDFNEDTRKFIYGYASIKDIIKILIKNNFIQYPNPANLENVRRYSCNPFFIPYFYTISVHKSENILKKLIQSKFNISYLKGQLDKDDEDFLNSRNVPLKKGEIYNFPYLYGAADNISLFKAHYINHNIFDSFDKFKYSYGIEIETAGGLIPEEELYKNGLIACRDGSISGFEYVTIPYEGITGFNSIKKVAKLLQENCYINEQQSMHIHLGRYPKTVDHIVALYRLLFNIQEDIYNMFPKYYRNTSRFKKRDYCAPLPYIQGITEGPEFVFNKLYEYLSGMSFDGNLDNREHPMDMSGQHKWAVSPRYKIFNFISLIFGKRKTIEFRIHSPTFNATKIINWIKLAIIILDTAETNVDDLIIPNTIQKGKYSLFKMIENTKMFSSEEKKELIKYFTIRKDIYTKTVDSIGITEIIQEQSYYIPKEELKTLINGDISEIFNWPDPFQKYHSQI